MERNFTQRQARAIDALGFKASQKDDTDLYTYPLLQSRKLINIDSGPSACGNPAPMHLVSHHTVKTHHWKRDKYQ